MSRKAILANVKEGRRQGFSILEFIGGEVTIRKDFFDLVTGAKKIGFNDIRIITNGRMFFYPDFARKIVLSGLYQIALTVAGHNSEIHDAHTLVPGSFRQTLQGIKNILAFKEQYGLNFSFLLNIMVSQKNYRYLGQMADFYANLGIKEINICHIMPLNKAICDKRIIAKMSQVAPFLAEIYKKYGDEIKLLFVEYPACLFPWRLRHLAFPCLEENSRKTRLKICSGCDFLKNCSGITWDYFDIYGEKEFKI